MPTENDTTASVPATATAATTQTAAAASSASTETSSDTAATTETATAGTTASDDYTPLLTAGAALTALPTTQDPGAPSNPSSNGSLIGKNDADDESLPDYGLDKDSLMEAEDGSTRTIGTLLAQTDLSTAKTQDLTVNGSDAATKTSYTGDVSGAAIAYEDTAGKEQTTTPAAQAAAAAKLTQITQDLSMTASDAGSPGKTSYGGEVAGAWVTYKNAQGGQQMTKVGAMALAIDANKALLANMTLPQGTGGGLTSFGGDVSAASVKYAPQGAASQINIPLQTLAQYTYPLVQDPGTPASPKATGSWGQVTADDKYLYVCVSHGGNTWVRIPYDTTWS